MIEKSQVGLHFNLCLLFCVLTLFLFATTEDKQEVCTKQTKCGLCLATAVVCNWCSLENFTHPRCDINLTLIQRGCPLSYINNERNKMTLLRNMPHRNEKRGQAAVQLTPQEVHLRLRPKKPYTFNISFKKAENYPVDLYIIMDMSTTMAQHKNQLASLSDVLASTMSNITENFRLGFGTFVDKKIMPFVSIVDENLDSPCSGCVATFGFKNNLPLTTDTARFKAEVNATKTSGNIDSPEGGFDAIMQAIVCEEQIGWRNSSRRLLLYATDAGFHIAGDGKLAGIVTPNDGQCHLDSNGYYSESLTQDYPSIGHLSQKINEKKVNIIFAVLAKQQLIYEMLSSMIEGSVTGVIEKNSENIVGLIRDNYLKISDSLELKTDKSEDVVVKFRAKCNTSTGWVEGGKCDKINIGQRVDFEVTVSVSQCPEDRRKWQDVLSIYPVGLNEKLRINLELACECGCERPEVEVKNSIHCSGNGTLECGSCTCLPGFFGKSCECEATNLQTASQEESCKKPNSTQICEGRGNCVCGKCDCYMVGRDPHKQFSGDYCERDYECDRSANGLVCSGPENGECHRGTCLCKNGYTGNDCSCLNSTKSCLAKNGRLCNGKGVCNCGICKCDKDSFQGPTCEDCLTCTGLCDVNKPCVQCKAHKKGSLSDDYCAENCTHVELVDTVEANSDKKLCQYRDDDDCIFRYSYYYSKNSVEAQRTKDCPKPLDTKLIVAAVVGGIVVIGIVLLLIWKLFDEVRYRREVARFEEDKKRARWVMDENPLYKQATSTFQNPAYGN